MEITELLVTTQRNDASDLHLSTGNPPMLRVHGDILPLQSPPLSPDDVKQMLYSVMTEHQRTEYERDLELDFAISLGDNLRFRVNAFNTITGPAAVLRNVPSKILTLAEMGTPPILEKLTMLHKGLILVTGPTGSGKSTTQAALVDHINKTRTSHIITIEDPIEYIHQTQRSLINQREVGVHTKSFSKALHSALREDPDVIMVGELRDLDTIQLALTAAETGHLVMGTLHTNSAPKTIDRIIDVFPSHSKEMIRSMLSVSLEAVITQTLLKKRSGGRVAGMEILLGTSAVRNLIREGKIHQLYSMMQMGSKVGMQTMKESIHNLVSNGIVTQEEAKIVLASSVDDGSNSDSGTENMPGSGGYGGNQRTGTSF